MKDTIKDLVNKNYRVYCIYVEIHHNYVEIVGNYNDFNNETIPFTVLIPIDKEEEVVFNPIYFMQNYIKNYKDILSYISKLTNTIYKIYHINGKCITIE